jgi:hypothetical protein
MRTESGSRTVAACRSPASSAVNGLAVKRQDARHERTSLAVRLAARSRSSRVVGARGQLEEGEDTRRGKTTSRRAWEHAAKSSRGAPSCARARARAIVLQRCGAAGGSADAARRCAPSTLLPPLFHATPPPRRTFCGARPVTVYSARSPPLASLWRRLCSTQPARRPRTLCRTRPRRQRAALRADDCGGALHRPLLQSRLICAGTADRRRTGDAAR